MTLFQRSFIGILLIIPIIAIGFYVMQINEEPYVTVEAPAQKPLPTVSANAAMPNNHPDPQLQIRAMIQQLEEKIAKNEHDFKDLLLLGRAYMMAKDYSKGVATYEKALLIEPNSLDVLLPLADGIGVLQQGQLTGRPYELIKKALTIDSETPMALWLIGKAEIQLGNVDKGAEYWTKLYNLFPVGSENRLKVGQQLTSIGKSPTDMAVTPASNSTANVPASQDSNQSQAIQITLDIDAETKAKLAGTTAFIYAKSATGMPMPIAAKKLPGDQLTNTITITEADELLPTRKLKDIAQIKVGIKISHQKDVDNKDAIFRTEQALPDSRTVTLEVKF